MLEIEVNNLKESDANLKGGRVRIALIDLSTESIPRYAHINGDLPVYPASVVKFVYLIAAYKWKEEGRITFTKSFRDDLQQMIGPSSNKATQKVFARLTETTPGPALSGTSYTDYKHKRHAVKRWLQSIGISDLHTVHPTYDGGGDIYGRDEQFLRDSGVAGGLARKAGSYANRQSMTALGTARLLTLLSNGELLTPKNTSEVLHFMQRDVSKQPYQRRRIAGGAEAVGREWVTYSKTGTWGPIFADAGIVESKSGLRFVIVVFIERNPPYRGDFISLLTERVLSELTDRANL